MLGNVVFAPGVLFRNNLLEQKVPARPGKTKRDHASGAWANRIANRVARGEASRGRRK